MRIPRATYRFQFNKHFRLADGLALVPYLQDLGVSHIYASPLFKATPGSLHGYDVCDFNQLNPEVGTEVDLAKLAAALHERNMGLVLDLVPNHMGISSPENGWWWDVLTHGKKSRFATHFDIDWNPSDQGLRGKILLPILGAEYGTILDRGELVVLFEAGKFVLSYHEHRFPLAPKTVAGLSAAPAALEALNADKAALDRLIRLQHYQLAFHEHGDAKLNYRRFFAVSSLAAVCVEDDRIFEAMHALLRKWLAAGYLDGLRVDHPDGLREPGEYLRRLRALAPDLWLVVEKILGPAESLPRSWPVQGTTGYDFLNEINGLFIDAGTEKVFTDFYVSFTGESADYSALLVEKKRAVLKTLLVAELTRLTGVLAVLAAQSDVARSFPRTDLHESVAEVIACFPVYRSYATGREEAGAADIAAVKMAVHLACEYRKDLPPGVFAFIQALLIKPQRGAGARNFIARFQQLTGAVMAKGAEDTAFYCFNRFVSSNEVGGSPGNFGAGVDQFHDFLKRQQTEWPHSQLTTSTHDTKRAEDVRARLNVLSEMPELWPQTARRWSEINSRHRDGPFPDRNAEYLFYQTLAGTWPLTEARAQAYMEKATHEAKQHTDWTKRNARYEDALRKFIAATLNNPDFARDVDQFVSRLSEAGAINSLAQTLIKLTAPGVPDIYQGCELWDFSLVDPDNRRPVNFACRRQLLESAVSTSPQEAWKQRAEGVPKLWLIQKTLKLRGRIANYSDLSYEPAFARGIKKDHVVAFSRGASTLTIVPRLPLKLNGDWQDTAIELPAGSWRNEFTGEDFAGKCEVRILFQKFPVALLVRKEHD
jgi:(1->4)-alpha-D-glucan 1-alpha-D-glucosylmutase